VNDIKGFLHLLLNNERGHLRDSRWIAFETTNNLEPRMCSLGRNN